MDRTRLATLWLTIAVAAAGRAVGQPLGPAFQINAYTTGAQRAPAVATGADGAFVVVWQSAGQDGDYFGIAGRRYAATGVAMGVEFVVNTYTPGLQERPAVAMAPDGGFLVVWDGYGDGGDYGDILARRYASTGAPAGAQFQVNSGAVYVGEGYAAVSATSTGFIVVWDDYDDVWARRVSSAGAPLGIETVVNSVRLGFQGSAAVAGTADGGFVVAWTDGAGYDYGDGYGDGQDGSGYGVFARRFDGNGQPAGGDFQVNASTLDDQYNVSLAARPDGGFVAVWEHLSLATLEETIVGQLFDAAGARLGSEFRVDAPGGEEVDDPQVVADQEGNFVVAWSARSGTSGPTILSRRYRADGQPVSGVEDLTGGSVADQIEPSLGAVPDGRYVAAWRREGGDGSDAAVFGRRFAAIQMTPSPAPSPSPTATPTATATSSRTPTASPTASATPTATATPTRTATATAPPTLTYTASATATPTRSATALPSQTPTLPPTVTDTPSPTPPRTPTATPTASRTATLAPTATGSPTPTATPTAAPTVTPAGSATATASALPTATGTATSTGSATATASALPTATRTATSTDTPTAVASATPEASATPSLGPSATHSGTPMPPPSPASPTASPAASATASPTGSATASPTRSPSPSATPTSSPDQPLTESPTATPSAAPSATPSPSHTPSPSPSPSPSHTPSPSPSNTPTASPTATAPASPTITAPAAASPTPSPTHTATVSATPTPRRCAGDCNGDGAVTVDELILAVNIALGSQAPSRCTAVDGDGDAQPTVAELTTAVARSRNGCTP